VFDHITAGKGMEIYNYLNLRDSNRSVAIMTNVPSDKKGRKDIIKIEDCDEHDIDTNALGFIDPDITVNVIVNNQVKKYKLSPPGELVNVIKCTNPRCITSIEQEIKQIFKLVEGTKTYRCKYCEHEKK